ncbi:unnamed protein product [Lupinus luteus]|uniref:Uncharacterized protein n=1 Tax=Lupinus luteus TaxID=3873 RepID=A0AAV1Y1S3_LUPLU
MANTKLVYMVLSILFASIIFNEFIIPTIGRPLKIENNEHLVSTYGNSVQEMSTVGQNIVWSSRHALELGGDDFRPTDPGHSPGAGHSSPKYNLVRKP